MGEPLVASPQPAMVETLTNHYFDYAHVPSSPSSERYKQKHAFLQEKWDYIEAQNAILRKRVQEVRQEVKKAAELKKTLCSMLDERGDQWYKQGLYIPLKEPPSNSIDTSYFTDIGQLRNEPMDLLPKKKSRSSKSRFKTAKAKEVQLSAEQKAEEERAKAKIVSIIDSVFSETARKSAEIEKEMKTKVDSVTKDVVGRGAQSTAHITRHPLDPSTSKQPPISPHSRMPAGASPSPKPVRPTRASQPPRKALSPHIPYKVYSSPSQSVPDPENSIGGVIDGIKFTYIPHPNSEVPASPYFPCPPSTSDSLEPLVSPTAAAVIPPSFSQSKPHNFRLDPRL